MLGHQCKHCENKCGKSKSQIKRLKIQGFCPYDMIPELQFTHNKEFLLEAHKALSKVEIVQKGFKCNGFLLKHPKNTNMNLQYYIPFEMDSADSILLITGGFGAELYDFHISDLDFKIIAEQSLNKWVHSALYQLGRGGNIHKRIAYHYVGFKYAVLKEKVNTWELRR
jgi:hypothetical protein